MLLIKSIKTTGKTELLLVVISSALLGIWATMETIALRNILLAIGALISILYLVNQPKSENQAQTAIRFNVVAYAPLFLILLMLIWVLAHYIFLSTNHSRQWDELTSTWLRAALAALIGVSTGIALTRNKNFLPILWFGLFISFLVLIYQYVPKAIQRDSLFAVDHFGDYIYWAKFSGVLAGTILISGLLGMVIDYFLFAMEKENGILSVSWPEKKVGSLVLFYALAGISLATYSFVFVFDAKAGVGMVSILIGFSILTALIVLGMQIQKRQIQRRNLGNYFLLVIVLLLMVLIISFLSLKHVKHNPGWGSLLEDITISSKVDEYPNWQDPSKFGYPKRADGTSVAGNTYERVSWGVVGYKLILNQPLGSGVLRSFPDQVKKLVPGFNSAAYTHSGWIDLGLSFGVLGLILIPAALLIALVRAVSTESPLFRATIITLSLAILVLYGVGEYAFQHGIEILFYVCSLVGGLTLMTSGKPKSISR
jgi:hypothetical protein